MTYSHLLRITILTMGLFILATYFAGCQEKRKDPFKGLNDKKMVKTLQQFPKKNNRWNVSDIDGRVLYDLIKENDYKRVLEIGTSNGYSATWMGYALKETGGELITVEIKEERAHEAINNFKEAGLHEIIDVRINDALDEIPELEGRFDFIFFDAAKSEYLNYFRQLKPQLQKGGAFSAHNVMDLKYSMQDFLDAIKEDPDFETKTYKQSGQGVLVGYKKKTSD